MGGIRNTIEQQINTLNWAVQLNESQYKAYACKTSKEAAFFIKDDLKKYFALCGLSRHKYAPKDLVSRAMNEVFRVRVILERSIQDMLYGMDYADRHLDFILNDKFYGRSKKQGISIRMPLASCEPTKRCASACYAHDALDAAPMAVVRGATNGLIALMYESGDDVLQTRILNKLRPHTLNAIKAAYKEIDLLKNGWTRPPRIRFSHVGEIVAYPNFANALGHQVKQMSDNRVACCIYTRHSNLTKLDPHIFAINYTLDSSQAISDIANTYPKYVRLVCSAFNGLLSRNVDINFLEHHPWQHCQPNGQGNICPATLPETKKRTCDAVSCNICFQQKIPNTLEFYESA
jgi:hypothetical protein